MTIRNVSEAKAELSALLVLVEQGEEVLIARAGKPIAKLVPIVNMAMPRKPGALKGLIHMREDFDASNSDIERDFYEGPIDPTA